MPRYRIHCGDRVRTVYLDKEGNEEHAPLSHYLLDTFIPEEEVVNFGIMSIRLNASPLSLIGMGSNNSLVKQAKEDIANGRINNFFRPYDNLGLDNPISVVYPQCFNEVFGGNSRAVYICDPTDNETVDWSKDNGYKYPLVVFCHGYLGNWQLYQGIWKDLNDCIVLSIGSRDLSGIFSPSDLNEIFDYYIPALERMGYHIDMDQLHLMGLSNGGTAIISAMQSPTAKRFKSITTISCDLNGLKRVPCQVNLIGGGKDSSSRLMPSQYSKLKAMGVDAGLYFKEEDNHFILVNQTTEIIDFLKERMQLQCVKMSE